MGPKTTQLAKLLDEMATLLRSVGEDPWAIWLEKDLYAIQSGDFHGVEHFLEAFGGMGSICDLVIHPVNGHRVSEGDIAVVNERFALLLGQASTLAKLVRRDAVMEQQLRQP